MHLCSLSQTPDLVTPFARHDFVAIRAITGSSSCPRLQVEELTVEATGNYNNPFNPEDVSLDATVTLPNGGKLIMPGFLSQAYSRKLDNGKEVLEADGLPVWKIRLCPTAVGKYTVVSTFKDHTGVATKIFEFTSTDSPEIGFARVSHQDPHYFEASNGSTFYPTGVNLMEAGPSGTFAYDAWLGKLAANKLTLQRLLLNSTKATFAIEQLGDAQENHGPFQFNLANAWKLDHVLDAARKDGIYSILSLDQAGELSIRDTDSEWKYNVLNRDNGGPLRVWTEFWTNPRAAQIYRAKLRYLVARYSADPKLFGWELWRNVDQVQEYDAATVRTWHAKIAGELHILDPYNHLITTGFASPVVDRDTYLLKSIDFAEMHAYSPKPVGLLADQLARHAEWGKPSLVTETSADRQSPHADIDLSGVQIHDPLWIGLVTGAAGGALSWWWDDLVDKNNLYPLLGNFEKFTEGVDFGAESFRISEASLAFSQGNESLPNRDLVLDQGPESWTASLANRPQTFDIVADRTFGRTPSRVLHGVKIRPELHNPLTINIVEPTESKLQVDIGNVSQKFGARLQIMVDGAKALDQPFPPRTHGPSVASDFGYSGSYSIPLEKGNHQIIVEDVGDDWMELNYRFSGVVPVKSPPANIWSLVGNSTALVWIQQKGWNWQSAVQEKQSFNPIPSSSAKLDDLASGLWDYQIWNTWTGQILTKGSLTVGLDGTATVQLPAFTSDLAVKLMRRK